MKRFLIQIVLLTVTLTSCKVDSPLEPIPEKSFPFENSNIRMEVVAESVPSQHIWDAHFFNETIGIVVTYDGKIYKTTDKGIT